jgi:PAS domain S-box-containing protein
LPEVTQRDERPWNDPLTFKSPRAHILPLTGGRLTGRVLENIELALALVIAAVAALALLALRRQMVATQQAIQQRDAAITKLAADREGLQLLLKEYIDQREEAEEVLRSSEEKYRVLVDNLSTIVFQIDAQARWTFLNPAWEAVTGWPVSTTIGRPAIEHVHPSEGGGTARMLKAMLSGERKRSRGFLRIRGADGETRWLEVNAIPTHDRSGIQTGLTGTLSDVTDQRRASAALQASEAKYRMLAESIDDVVSLQEIDGTAIYYSPSTERAMGYTATEMLGRDVYALVHPDDLPRIVGGVHLAALRGETPLFEWRCRCKNGSYVCM